jgi:mRNA interferase RelE/StbE
VSGPRWTVQFANSARRDLRRLDAPVRNRILAAVESLAADPFHGDVKRLVGIDPPEWRFRVGDWRIRFTRDADTRTLEALRVLPRGGQPRCAPRDRYIRESPTPERLWLEAPDLRPRDRRLEVLRGLLRRSGGPSADARTPVGGPASLSRGAPCERGGLRKGPVGRGGRCQRVWSAKSRLRIA